MELIEFRAADWLDTTERVFDFAARASDRFKYGDAKTKREIISAIGSNLTILNRKLQFEANPWFQPIADMAGAGIDEKYEGITSDIEPKEALIGPRIISWQGWQFVVQTLDDAKFEKIDVQKIRESLDGG